MVIPAGGGTETVTVSATVRDPRRAGKQVSLDVRPGELVPGAVIDKNSIVWPATDPGAGTSTYIASDGSEVGWWLPAATVDTTYTLTLQIHVPNAAATSLLYKPSATVTLDESPPPPVPQSDAGASTTIPDTALGGAFTFSVGSDVDWLRFQTVDTGVEFAPLAALAVPVDHFAVKASLKTVSTGQPFTVTVTALDASNQPVTAYAGPLKLDDSVTHTLQVTGPATWSNGVGTASATIAKPADDDHVVAADGSGVSPGATGSSRGITVIGPADHFRLRLSDRAVYVGDRLRVWVTALDAVGHHVTSYAGPVSLSDSSGTLTVTDPGKWHDGVVRETVTIGVPFADDVVHATAAGSVTGASAAFDVFVRIHHFVVTVSPSVVVRGADAALTVTAKDAHGNTVAGYTGPVHVSGTAGWSDAARCADVDGRGRQGDGRVRRRRTAADPRRRRVGSARTPGRNEQRGHRRQDAVTNDFTERAPPREPRRRSA